MKGFPHVLRLPGRGEVNPHRRLSPAMKRFMARYIFYLEMLGYAAVSLVALAIVACFFFQVDDVISNTGDTVPIKPQAQSIQRDANSLVTRVFVQNHQNVHRGDPLIEVVENPKWISRYRVMNQMQSLLDEIIAPGQAAELAKKSLEQDPKKPGAQKKTASASADTDTSAKHDDEKPPLPAIALAPEEEKLKASLKQRLAVWDETEVNKSPRILIRSPIDGTAIVPDDLAFKQMDADTEIMKVVDLNDLRLTAKLAGDTVADARTGQRAIIKAISPDYKTGLVFRGDTVPKGRYFWQRERVVSYSLLDPKIKEIVKKAFKDRKITQRDDIPFKVNEVAGVEVDADIETKRQRSGARDQPEADDNLSPGPKPVVADAPADMELSGKVIEGKHHLNVQVADLPPAVTKQVRRIVARQLPGQQIDAPQQPTEGDQSARLEPLRVEAVRDVQVIAKLKGENAKAKGSSAKLKQEAAEKAVRGATYEKISDARQFEATVQIQNPPQFLKDRVLELLDLGKEVKAKVDVRTGRRPVAFLLLKR